MNDRAEEIRVRMSQVRNDIGEDVNELVDAAKTLVDWREYVRSAPWATAGLACALGFLIVPSKKPGVAVGEAFRQFSNGNADAAFVPSRKPSLLKTVAGNLAAITMRLAAGQIAKHASTLFAGGLSGNADRDAFAHSDDASTKCG